jgi:hypothetical protein
LHFRLFFAYNQSVPNRRCRVLFTDMAGVTHTADVTGESLYEAAVAAIAEFKKCGFSDAIGGPATSLRVAVQSPSTEHEIAVSKVREWLASNGKSPAQQMLKTRLRELLGE